MNERETAIYVLEHNKEIRDWYKKEHDFTVKDIDNEDFDLGGMIIEDGITDNVIVEDENADEFTWYPFGELTKCRKEAKKIKREQAKRSTFAKKIQDRKNKIYEAGAPERRRIIEIECAENKRFRDEIDFSSPRACNERAIEKYVKNPTPENLQEIKLLAKLEPKLYPELYPEWEPEWDILRWMQENQSSATRAVNQGFSIEYTGSKPRTFLVGN